MNVIEIAENLIVGSDKAKILEKAQEIINVCGILGIEVKNEEVPTQYDGEPIGELFLKLSVTADNQETSLENVAKAYVQLKARQHAEVKASYQQTDKKQPLTAEDVFKKTTGIEVDAIPKGSIYELHWKRLKQQIEPLAKQMYVASLQSVVELTNSWMFDGTPEEESSPFFSEEQETTVDNLLESGSDHFQNFRLQQQEEPNQKTIAGSSASQQRLTGI